MRPLWLLYLRLAHTWIVPWWRLRGYGTIAIGGQRFRFYEAGAPAHAWWAAQARAGRWETEVISFFTRVITPGDTVFDVGSYVGPYALLASRLVGTGGRVFAFEPDPVARALLERNVGANGASNIVIVDAAITEAAGSVSLSTDVPGAGGATTRTGADGAKVRSLPLRTACEELGAVPDVLKVDVEGGEASVFTDDALDVLEPTRALVVEVHEDALRERGSSGEDLLRRLAAGGWALSVFEERFAGNYNVAATRAP